jgi:hypothetical protein
MRRCECEQKATKLRTNVSVDDDILLLICEFSLRDASATKATVAEVSSLRLLNVAMASGLLEKLHDATFASIISRLDESYDERRNSSIQEINNQGTPQNVQTWHDGTVSVYDATKATNMHAINIVHFSQKRQTRQLLSLYNKVRTGNQHTTKLAIDAMLSIEHNEYEMWPKIKKALLITSVV